MVDTFTQATWILILIPMPVVAFMSIVSFIRYQEK